MRKLDSHDRAVLDLRLGLAKRGWHTHLVHGIIDGRCTCSDANCPRKKRGKHPMFEGHDRGATIDPDVIRREARHRGRNVGLHLGLSGLAALDVDPRNGGWEALAHLEEEHGPLPRDIVGETGGGGIHIFFRADPARPLPSKLLPGIDVLQGNLYPILPPSRHISGKRYQWADGSSPADGLLLLMPPPEWVFSFSQKPPAPKVGKDDWATSIRRPPPEETAEEVRKAQSALEAVSSDCPYPQWIEIVWALASTEWSIARELALEWSENAPHRFEQEAFDRIWESADLERPDAVQIGTLYFYAKQEGWTATGAGTSLPDIIGDITNGRRFAAAHQGGFLHVTAEKKWYRFDGNRWLRCSVGEEVDAAKSIAQQVFEEAVVRYKEDASDKNKSLMSQAANVHRHAGRLAAMLSLAAAEPRMSVPDASVFDADPMLLGVRNGVLDLRSGKLIPATPEQLIRKQAAVAFDPGAKCPRFKALIRRILPSTEKAAFAKRIIGYALTGDVGEEKLLFACGSGANGKSVLVNILSWLLGDYSVSVGTELLARSKHSSEADRYKASLAGARLALLNEVGEDDVWDDQRVKELTSREKIPARMLYGEPFSFSPTHKLFIRGNHRPGVRDSGYAMWRRMILLMFDVQIPEEEQVKNLDALLFSEEGSGILNWALEGCLEWQRLGLAVPEIVARETDRYRQDTDIMGDWIEARCTVTPGARAEIKVIYKNYREYFTEAGLQPVSQPKFTRQIQNKDFQTLKSNGKNFVLGITLKIDDDEEDWGSGSAHSDEKAALSKKSYGRLGL